MAGVDAGPPPAPALTRLPHSVTRSFTTCFTATCGGTGAVRSAARRTRARSDRRPTHREPVGEAAARVDGAEAAAAQHGAHLVQLLEALLVRFGCEDAGGSVRAADPACPPSRLPAARVPGWRSFTGRCSTPPGPQRCAREPNLESSIAGGLPRSRPARTRDGGLPAAPHTGLRGQGGRWRGGRRGGPRRAQQAKRLGRLAPGFWAAKAVSLRGGGAPSPRPLPLAPRAVLRPQPAEATAEGS